jgi:cytoskeletal protein CcmA (bactofilin family)
MFSRNRSQSPAPHDPSTRSNAPGPATAVAEPPVEPATSPESEGPAPTRRFTDAVAPCATRLGRLQIRGILTGSDSVELSGTFNGPIIVDGLCRVNAGGHVTGDLTAGDAVIAGDIQGRLTVIGRLELGAHARVLSDIEAGTIAIAEGCFIEGRIHMRGSDVGSQPVSFKEKRRGKRRRHHAHKASPPDAAAVASPPSVPAPPATTDPPEGSSGA